MLLVHLQLATEGYADTVRSHHDRKAWGDDVDDFRPERMLDGGFQKLPPNSWKPVSYC